eukprot:COSAG02_NODE_5413_length_4349_cov_3.538118_4_plen_100_part_00
MRMGRLLLPHLLRRLAHRAAAENISRAGLRFLLSDNNANSALRLCELRADATVHQVNRSCSTFVSESMAPVRWRYRRCVTSRERFALHPVHQHTSRRVD